MLHPTKQNIFRLIAHRSLTNRPRSERSQRCSKPVDCDARTHVLVRTPTIEWNDTADIELRPMITLEEEALTTWLSGFIVLPSLPGFYRCPHLRSTRVAMLDIFLKVKVFFTSVLAHNAVHRGLDVALVRLLERSGWKGRNPIFYAVNWSWVPSAPITTLPQATKFLLCRVGDSR